MTKLADLYKHFIRRRSIKNTVMQEEADKLFLHNVMIKGTIDPAAAAKVIQQHSLNRVDSQYGRKLVQLVQAEYQDNKPELSDVHKEKRDTHGKIPYPPRTRSETPAKDKRNK